MRCLGKIAVCLAGGLVLSIGARAADVVSAGNPYAPIVARNVFGLNPPSTNIIPTSEDTQLPKITLNGITDILGQLQALYKVSPKPGQKDAKDESYILSEGQAQDDIEVMHIDEKTALVTFNNHGKVQEIPLANAPKINAPSAPTGGGSSGGNIPPRLGSRVGGSGPAGRVGGPGRVMSGGASANPGGTGNNPALNNSSTRGPGGYANQSATPANLSAEEHMVLMAAQHLKAQQDGDPATVIFPPTPFDAELGINPPTLPNTSASGTSHAFRK
jgi:hypothetical protein